MRLPSSLPTLSLLLALTVLVPAGAQQSAEADASEETLSRRVQSLMAMSSEQRRATLKAMAPAERRGLWLELKKTQRGTEPPLGYSEMTPRSHDGQGQDRAQRAVGTIQYDDGTITTSFGGGAIIGNRFDTAEGNPVLASGTVSTVSAVVVPGPAFTTDSAGFVLLGPQTAGGGAFALFSSFTNATGTVDTVTFAGIGASYTGSSFLVLFGDFANSYIPAFGTGTANGQGHHGIVGYTGGMGPNITGTLDFGGTLNGLVRAGGNVLPVELMSFDSE